MPFFLHVQSVEVADCLAHYHAIIPPDRATPHTADPHSYTLCWPAAVPTWACSPWCIPCCLDVQDSDAMRGPQSPTPYLGTYATAAAAHTAAKTHRGLFPVVITFAASAEESIAWRVREEDRTTRYGASAIPLPWVDEPWQAQLNLLHYAYLSPTKPGLLAYTPSEEWGVTDRQLCIRPGKYLEQFAPCLSPTQRDEYCAQIKALNDRNTLRFATSEHDVLSVYRSGPTSCMSHTLSDYASSSHPVLAYADSPDLQVAYLGTLASYEDKIRARALVWPARKLFTRIYGDTTLRILLEHAGYTQGALVGAKLRRIADEHADAYLMPYVDGCESCEALDRHYFVLREDSDGEYCCTNTNGLTDGDINRDDEENDEYYTCCGFDGCDTQVDDEGDVCRSCQLNRWICTNCDEISYDLDEGLTIDEYGEVCDHCYRLLARTCDECDDEFFPVTFSGSDTDERMMGDVPRGLCLACGEALIKAVQTEAADEARRATIIYALETALNTNSFRSDSE